MCGNFACTPQFVVGEYRFQAVLEALDGMEGGTRSSRCGATGRIRRIQGQSECGERGEESKNGPLSKAA